MYRSGTGWKTLKFSDKPFKRHARTIQHLKGTIHRHQYVHQA
jgi:hypothetical protein